MNIIFAIVWCTFEAKLGKSWGLSFVLLSRGSFGGHPPKISCLSSKRVIFIRYQVQITALLFSPDIHVWLCLFRKWSKCLQGDRLFKVVVSSRWSSLQGGRLFKVVVSSRWSFFFKMVVPCKDLYCSPFSGIPPTLRTPLKTTDFKSSAEMCGI